MSENASKPTSKTDWARVSALTDAEIDTSEIPPLGDSFFSRARLRLPAQPLVEVTLHLDPQVLDWFQKHGSASYENLINAALRIYAQAHATYSSGPEGSA
jgi:uncharacterized protein (DUF4415 family)